MSIPILKDHNKNVDGYCGELDSPVEVRPITANDLPKKQVNRLSHLIGKLGIFADRVLIKSEEVVDKVRKGLKTISAGIDVASDKIREISLTPIPAIPGMSLFMKNTGKNNTNTAMSWGELDQDNADLEGLKEELDNLHHKFFSLIANIYTASEEQLDGQDQKTLAAEVLNGYVEQIAEIVGLDEEEEDYMDEDYQPQNASDYLNQQQYVDNMNQPYANYSLVDTINYIAESGSGKEIAEFGLLNWGKKLQRQASAGFLAGRGFRNAQKGLPMSSMTYSQRIAAGSDPVKKYSLMDNLAGVQSGVRKGLDFAFRTGAKGRRRMRWGRVAGVAAAGAAGAGTVGYIHNRNKPKRYNIFNM
jgi:hypothetical protein